MTTGWMRGLFAASLVVAGCATLPTGPSVMVLPTSGKPFEQFQAEDAACKQWASSQVGPPGTPVNQNAVAGGAIGTLLGAGLGAAIGAAGGAPGIGAAIGAGSGLLIGSATGANADQAAGWSAQQRYDAAYQQCMYAKGNQIPGAVQPVRRYRTALPPPPPPPGYGVPAAPSGSAPSPSAPSTSVPPSGMIPPPPPGMPPAPPPGL
jgi:hypothetical protein